ncbi:MAG TPA: hypothetical protein VGG74_17830 [Kofleriaceae bacterium]|jgi:hypothetical protein
MRFVIVSILLASTAALAAPPDIDFDADAPPAPAPAPDATTAPTPIPTTRGSDAPPAPSDPSLPAPTKVRKWVELYGAIAGGIEDETLQQPSSNTTQAQHPTVAISRLGVRGGFGDHVTFASEFEASIGGPMGYGTSVWEGEAAIAVWDQFVRYQRGGFAVAVGRIEDPASFDYFSEHVADLLLADEYTEYPLLYSGADRGNGLYASYDLTPNLTIGATFHSTNPTGITGSLVIGGKLAPFERPFYLASAQVGVTSGNLPDQNLHIYFGSPSLIWHSKYLDAQAEIQMYSLDTQVDTIADQTIRGYNLRAGARGKLPTSPHGKLAPFVNVSRNVNEILDPTHELYRLPDLYKSIEVSGGVDFDYYKRNGVGVEYALVDSWEPGQHELQHYVNIATTYWIEDSLSVGLRYAIYADQVSGAASVVGNRSLFLTARLTLD